MCGIAFGKDNPLLIHVRLGRIQEQVGPVIVVSGCKLSCFGVSSVFALNFKTISGESVGSENRPLAGQEGQSLLLLPRPAWREPV